MENAAWRLALGGVRKLHWRTFYEPQKQNRPRTYEEKRGDKKGMENAAWRLALGGVRKRYQKAVSESVNSRGRRRSMWACAFRATFISSISFIYLLYLSPLFTFIQ
jgi:hypothetical protein